MSSAPFNGWSSTLSIQKETTFAAASAQTVYSLAGKVAFSMQPVLTNGNQRTTLWRQTSEDTFSSRFWVGSFECELGIHAMLKILCDSFFELVATTALGGGKTQYDYRLRRLAAAGSFKLGLEYNGGAVLAFQGVVIDAITVTIRLKAPVRIKVDFKFVTSVAGASPALGAMTEIRNVQVIPSNCEVDLSGAAMAYLQQAIFKITDTKNPARVGEDGTASKFSPAGAQGFSGELLELYNPASTIPGLVAAQTPAPLKFILNDGGGNSLTWNLAGALFDTGTPDGTGKGDLGYRATFLGRQAQDDLTNETKLSLVF